MNLTPEFCSSLFQRYSLGTPLSWTRMSKGYSNANFKVITSQGTFLLKIYLDEDLGEVPYEINLLVRLKAEHFPAAFPLPDQSDQYIQTTELGQAVIYQFISGTEPIPNPKSVASIARGIAQLNTFPEWKDHARKNYLDFELCGIVLEALAKHPSRFPEIETYYQEQTAFLTPHMGTELPQGLIHADLFTDNSLFDGDDLLAIIDFEGACTDDLLYDVAMTINGFCFEDQVLDSELMKVFLQAYEQVRPLTAAEKALLPIYIQYTIHAMCGWHIKTYLEGGCIDSKRYGRIFQLMDRVKRLRAQSPA